MNITLITAILTAIVSIFGTLYVTQSKNIDKNITEQRKTWRDDLRNKIEELSKIDLSIDTIYQEIYIIRNYFYVRINPYRDKPIIDKFNLLLQTINEKKKLLV